MLMMVFGTLVVRNKPDLMLFVFDVLAGNDVVDKLCMFNRMLQTGGHQGRLDGIVFTKSNMVSDKVGAVLTMTCVAGASVMFVGIG